MNAATIEFFSEMSMNLHDNRFGYHTMKGEMIIMSKLERLNAEIEILRERLHKMVEQKKGFLTDDDVRTLSEELDCLIVEQTRCKMLESK